MKTVPLLVTLLLGFSLAAFGAPPKKPATPNPVHKVTVSERLRHLIDTTLPKIASIARPVPLGNRTDLSERQAEFAARAATGTDAEKPMYDAAASVCAALIQAEDEHELTVANLRKSEKTHGPQDREDLEIHSSSRGWDAGAVARANNAKQNKENADSKKAVLEKEKFLTKGAIDSWATRVTQIQAGIELVYEKELIAEKQAHTPPPVVVATVPPVPPPAPAPTPAAPSAGEAYSPSGMWKNPNPNPNAKTNPDFLIKDDNSVSHGQRRGTWAWQDSAKRTMTMKWTDGPIDTLTLSPDGQTLSGANSHGQTMTLNRTH